MLASKIPMILINKLLDCWVAKRSEIYSTMVITIEGIKRNIKYRHYLGKFLLHQPQSGMLTIQYQNQIRLNMGD